MMNVPANISAVTDIKSGNTTIHLDMSVLNKILAECPERADKIVRSVAFDVQGRAVIYSRWKTGANRASIFVRTSKTNGYQAASEAAKQAAAAKGVIVETHDPTPGDPEVGTAYVAPGMEYSFFLEFGTSRMPAYPFIFPAVEDARGQFMAKFADLFK